MYEAPVEVRGTLIRHVPCSSTQETRDDEMAHELEIKVLDQTGVRTALLTNALPLVPKYHAAGGRAFDQLPLVSLLVSGRAETRQSNIRHVQNQPGSSAPEIVAHDGVGVTNPDKTGRKTIARPRPMVPH
ncbi:hypothetical protein CHU98_g6439 [Xylaria longipes]|nr:hypothetical protein CHU98_g6439 [Xylaria longipes]